MASQSTLWKQFAGVASAVAYLHVSARLAHRNINPSNILIYCDETSHELILKVTGFHHSANLSPNASTPDLAPGTPMSNDIWKLGRVFTELLTYLVRNGPGGVHKFHTSTTTAIDKGNSRSLINNRFDGGEKVEPEVLTRITALSLESENAAQLVPLLRMMPSDPSERPNAQEVCQSLIEVGTL